MAIASPLPAEESDAADAQSASNPADGGAAPPPRPFAQYIYKSGDPLWQDVATLMLLREFNFLWRAGGSEAFTATYNVVPTADRAGFVELLPNATAVRSVDTFTYSSTLHHSAVGAFIAGFVLGLGDRHQDNMLLVGPRQDTFAHVDFGYVAGQRTWFDANTLPVPERFMRCCIAAGKWADFVNDCAFAFTILQARRSEIFAVAATFAEPLTRAGYPRYIDELLEGHTAETVRALVEAAPKDIARRFKNLTTPCRMRRSRASASAPTRAPVLPSCAAVEVDS